jgi:hypothetical protein
MSTAPQAGGGLGSPGTLPRPARRVLTPPPGPGGRLAAAAPRQTGARTLLSGVFALVVCVGLTVGLLVVLARVLKR